MGHYAFVNTGNEVVSVIVGRHENDLVEGIESWETYYGNRKGMTCVRTSYNTRGGVHYDPETGEPSGDQSKALRKNYAGIGFTYDEERDAFIPPKPFNSWVLNEATCWWEAPVSYPEDGNVYTWDENTTSWIEVTE